jgi:uncharacterized protein YyaL (SSP411 family)
LQQGADYLNPPAALQESDLSSAVEKLLDDFDAEFGGFGGAPKFPPTMTLEFLLRNYERTASASARTMVELTLDRMARGGVYDQLRGGFSRYSVGANWVIPHFEKMLYDNAQLLRVYAHAGRRLNSQFAQRIANETAEFLLTDLLTAEGGFASALDADTGGVEGLTYAWTQSELLGVLGAEDGTWAATLLGVSAVGTFENGTSVIQLKVDAQDPVRWARVRSTLLQSRLQRPQPALDDKVVSAWNGLAIAALAEVGAAEGNAEWVAAAARAANYLLEVHIVDGRLRRSSRRGIVGSAHGVLEDYACLADGLLALHQATGGAHWLTSAVALLKTALERFAAQRDEPGHYFDTADDAERLLQRPSDLTDGATPCGASALAGALLAASVLTTSEFATDLAQASRAALETAGLSAMGQPRYAGNWLAIAEATIRGPLQITVVGEVESRIVV